jgi:hypothetical protein
LPKADWDDLEEVDSMMILTKLVCILLLAGGLAWPAFAAQGDAGSGPTTGATSTNDAGSATSRWAPGGGKNGAGQSAATNQGATSDNMGTTPNPQTDRDRPPGDAQTSDKRGERAQTPAPQGSTGAGQTTATNRGATSDPTGEARPAPAQPVTPGGGKKGGT